MVDPSAEFLALTAHPQVGRWIADRHVTIVFDPVTATIIWSNGAASDMLEVDDVSGLNRSTSRRQILVAELSRLLSEPSSQGAGGVYGQIRGKIVLPVGVYQVTITCSAYPLVPPARPGLYLVTMSWTLREREEKWPLSQFCRLVAGRRTATIADPSGMYFVSTDDAAKALVGQALVSAPANGLKHALAILPGADIHLIGGLDLYLVLMDKPAADAAVRALVPPPVPAAGRPVPPPVPGRAVPPPVPPPVPPAAPMAAPPPFPVAPPRVPVPPQMPPVPGAPSRTAPPFAAPPPVPPAMPPVPPVMPPVPAPMPPTPPALPPVAAPAPVAMTPPPPRPAAPPAGEVVRPLHFAWQMDAEYRFTYVSDRLAEALGAPPGYPMGLGWRDLCADPGFDPGGQVEQALTAGEPWGGLTVYWPTNDGTRRIPVDLSGLAIQAGSGFGGYRGFGLARVTEALPIRPVAPAVTIPPAPPAIPPLADAGLSRLSRPEEAAFRQIAEALGARYEGDSRATRPSAIVTPPPRPVPPPLDPRLLIERLPLAVIVARGEEILALNPAALALLGYPDRAAIDARGGLGAILGNRPEAPVGSSRREDAPLRLATGTGGTVEVRARIAPVPWTDGMAALVTLEPARPDIDALDISVSGDGVLVLDAAGRIASADARAAALLARPVDALVGTDPTELVLSSETARQIALESRGDVVPDAALEAVVFLPDGGERAVRVSVVHLDAGPIRRIALLIGDLSAARAREARLEDALTTAERLIDRKTALLSHLGQELRTPLNAIIGFAEVMLEERIGPIGTPRYREFLRDIRASGAHILSLVNDLVDLSRIESGRPERAAAPAAELNPVVREAIDLMQTEAQAERVLVRSSLGSGLPLMLADPAAVRRIVLNLLSNAIRYNVAGGQAIVSTAHDDGSGLVIRIRDTGVGMTREEIAAALDPERQKSLVHGDADVPAGSGLGLPLAKALTEANGGTFRLVSQPGQGTLVEIALPCEPA